LNDDVILEIDKNDTTDYATLREIVAERPNKKVNILIFRAEKKITKEATLGEKEKTTIKFEMDIPNIEELKDVLGRGNAKIQEEIDNLKEEIEKLKSK